MDSGLRNFMELSRVRKGIHETGRDRRSDVELMDTQRNGVEIMSVSMCEGVIPKEESEASECFVLTWHLEFLKFSMMALICVKGLNHIELRIGVPRAAGIEYLLESLEMVDETHFQISKCATFKRAMQNVAIDKLDRLNKLRRA